MQPWRLKQLSTSKVITLDQSQNFVGRNIQAKQFCLTSDKVSRSHSYLFIADEGHLYIQDLKSVNGTFVNGSQIDCFILHKLFPGDQIGFGLPKLSHAQTKADKETFFEVLPQSLQEEVPKSVAHTGAENLNLIPKSNESLDEIVITNICSLANEKTETATRRSQRCSNRGSTLVNERRITIESDDESLQTKPLSAVKMVLGNHQELVLSTSSKTEEVVKTTNQPEKLVVPTAELTDNPIVIDITDEDEDIDFSCSQLFQMSQIVSDRVSDETYQKIKNELAEMDYCTDGVVVNAEPIDLEDENQGGFENTQEIFELLEDKAEQSPHHQVVEAIDDLVCVFGTEADNKEESATRRSPRNIKQAPTKRKSSLPLPTDNKRAKTVKGRSFNEKDFLKELKRRKSRSPHVEKDSLKEERRKKLKELTGSTSPLPVTAQSTPVEQAEETPHPKCKKRISGQPTVTTILGMDLNSEPDNHTKETRGRRKSLNIEKNCSAYPVRSQSLTRSEARRMSVHQECKPKNTRSKSLSKYPLRPTLSRECKNLEPLPKLQSSATLLDLNDCKPKRATKQKSCDGTLQDSSSVITMAMEPLRWQKYNNAETPSLSRNLATQEDKKPGSSTLTSRNVAISETTLDLNSGKRKSGRHPKRKSVEVLPEDSNPEKYLNAKKTSAKVIPTSTDSYHLNTYTVGCNQQEASRLLMWGKGVPSRKPLNNRRLPKVDDIVREMVHWIPERLLQQLQNDVSAPIIKLPTKIPTLFTSFQQYYYTFSKMVLMESWQSLFKGFRDSNESPKKMKVQHVRVVNDTLVLDCISVISKEDVKHGNFYKPEDLVMLECAMRNKTHVLSMNFAIVQSCRRSLVANNGVRHSINQLLNGPNPHTILEFTVLTRYQPQLELNTKMTHFIKPLSTMRTYLMLIRAMKEMEHSPLCTMILNPKVSDYKFPVTHREVRFRNNTCNEEQRTIVLEAASLCMGNRPGIYCVKGPPGTGKSTVIVNLLQQILFAENRQTKNSGNPMILLTAPSNTAVDNLIFKISAARSSLLAELRPKIKLVRIGPESSIHKDLLNYSLPKLAEKHLPIKLHDHPDIKAAKERKENLLQVAKTVLGNQYQNELRQCEKLIIEKSNIICTTLHSCINSRLIDAVNTGLVRFTCCVIDEATQCHEIESLLPLVLGIDKFVLVGDPQQLNATILSREASKLGFGESLFTRLSKSFGVDPRSPIRMLTEQYRMHPEICEFPSKRFYEGKLRTKANPKNKLPNAIRPYLVFNCEKLSPSDDYTNMDEVILIKKLLKTICDMLDSNYSYTVGIITPYNAQKDLLSNHIGRNEYCQVTINTVDSFQGSEKDIVIISCVRDSSNTFLQNQNRLNVALTRAKQALYIIGNYSLFKECPLLYDIREDAKRRKVLLDIKQNPRTIDSLRRYLVKAN